MADVFTFLGIWGSWVPFALLAYLACEPLRVMKGTPNGHK